MEALIVVMSIGVSSIGNAAFDPNNSVAVSAAAAQAAKVAATRRAYYLTDYGNENGPFGSYVDCVNTGLVALDWLQAQNGGRGELGIMIFQDAYGMYWFTDPQAGVEQPDGSWLTFQTSLTIRRPGTTVVASAHTHPSTLPDGTGVTVDDDGDNQSDLPMFVVKADDSIWYFKPSSHRAKLYGKIMNGQLVTKYTHAEQLNDDTYDPYQVATSTGMGSNDGTVLLEGSAIGLIGAGVITGLIFGGGSSSSGSNPSFGDTGTNIPMPVQLCMNGTIRDPITGHCGP